MLSFSYLRSVSVSSRYATASRLNAKRFRNSAVESSVSPPVTITPIDKFPPEPPKGLAALAGSSSIELNWEQNSESDLRGYFVYRATGDGSFERMGEVLEVPTYSDRAVQSGARYRYAVSAIDRSGDVARRAFAKIGVLMASSGRAGKPLHPTNLHVNKGLFPRDTVQSRLPDPGWLDRWLDEQIRFDSACEARVVRAILRSLSPLLGLSLETVHDLNRHRKRLASTQPARAGASSANVAVR